MSSFVKSRTVAIAIGIIGVVMMSLAPASAGSTVRDHRDKPVVRDHRAGQPVVRDQRGASSGGVTVKDSPGKRKPPCYGNLCNVEKVCVGPACF